MTTRIKLLHLVLQLGFGGAESMVVLQARHLDRSRFDVHVWSLDSGGDNVARLEASGIPVRVLGKGRGFSWRFFRRFRALMRDAKFDVVHAHNDAAARWAVLGTWGLRPRPLRLRTEHTFHENGRTAHAVDHLLTGWAFDADIGVCETITRRHQAHDPLHRRRYHTIPNAIDVSAPADEPSAARAALRADPSAEVIVNLGNLRSAKGQMVLVEAFARVAATRPRAVLCIIGEGELRPRIEALSRDRGIASRVRLLGHRADAAELLSGADVVVQSSVREGMPVALLEAARARRRIVATDVGGTREFVRDGETGWLVPPEDPEALAQALGAALSQASGAARADAAWALVRERHDIVAVTRQAETLYEELLRRVQGEV